MDSSFKGDYFRPFSIRSIKIPSTIKNKMPEEIKIYIKKVILSFILSLLLNTALFTLNEESKKHLNFILAPQNSERNDLKPM